MDWLMNLFSGVDNGGIGGSLGGILGGAADGGGGGDMMGMMDPLGLMKMLGGGGDSKGTSGAPALQQVLMQNQARPFIARSLGVPDNMSGMYSPRSLGGY